MKKFENLGRSLSKTAQKNIIGGVGDGGDGGGESCYIWMNSGSNGSGSSMTCDYRLTDFAGNFVGYRCEVACLYGCVSSGCSFTLC